MGVTISVALVHARRVPFDDMGVGRPPSFYLSPTSKGRRAFTLDLNDAIFDPVFAYAMATGPERSIQDTVRELLVQATTEDARDGAIRGARMQAYREARTLVFEEMSQKLKEVSALLKLRAMPDAAVGAFPENQIASASDDL
jgi:hypothetical protein